MKEKYEVETIFINFYIVVQTQFQKTIHILRSDDGQEYFNNTPQQNGLAIRKNKHLLEVAQALLFSHQISTYFWGEAVFTVAYLTNRMSNNQDSTSPLGNISVDLLPHVQCTSSNSEFVYSDPKSSSKLEFDDSNLLIVIRKGVRSCTQHPLSKYVSYENLSPEFRVFTLQLSVLETPNTLQDALRTPEWKESVFEEMKALE
ncbi:hypothetical protein CR513_43230, partial [Mucuna pruriens]